MPRSLKEPEGCSASNFSQMLLPATRLSLRDWKSGVSRWRGIVGFFRAQVVGVCLRVGA